MYKNIHKKLNQKNRYFKRFSGVALILLFFSTHVFAQKKLILTTNINKGWTITKKSQVYPTYPQPLNTDWLINKNPGVINSNWTSDVKIANITLDQTIPVINVGNKAKPIWIAENLCNHFDYSEKPSTYYFRNTFYLSECIDISSAILQFTTDNISRVYINGHQIARNGGLVDYPGNSTQCDNICGYFNKALIDNPPAYDFNSEGVNIVEYADIKDYLETGVNVIAIENLNTGGCETNYAWVCFNMEIQYSGSLITTAIENLKHQDCNHEGSFDIIPSGGEGPYSYHIDGQNPQDNGTFQNLGPGVHDVVIEDATGCISRATVTIDNLKTIPELIIDDIDIETDCYDTTAFISLNPKDNGYELEFSLDDASYSDGAIFNNLTPGTHSVQGINEFGCATEPYIFEIFFNEGKVIKDETIDLCHGETFALNNKTYDHSQIIIDTLPVSGSRCDTIHRIDLRISELKEADLNFEICAGEEIEVNGNKYGQAGNYTQRYTDENGCDSTVYIRIDMKDEKICAEGDCTFFIPNVFTPNNDGINDVFEIKADYITISQISIFNRWGDVVFSGSGPNISWSGLEKNRPAPAGNYVYLVRGVCANGYQFTRSGGVTVVR